MHCQLTKLRRDIFGRLNEHPRHSSVIKEVFTLAVSVGSSKILNDLQVSILVPLLGVSLVKLGPSSLKVMVMAGTCGELVKAAKQNNEYVIQGAHTCS